LRLIDAAQSCGNSEAVIAEGVESNRGRLRIPDRSYLRTKKGATASVGESLRQLQTGKKNK
jgi:hypothetical protein